MTVVCCLGDSITAGTPLWDPNPEVRARIGSRLDERSAWPYWAGLAHPSVEFRNHGFVGLIERGLETFDLEYDVHAFNEPLPRVRIIPISEFDPAQFL